MFCLVLFSYEVGKTVVKYTTSRAGIVRAHVALIKISLAILQFIRAGIIDEGTGSQLLSLVKRPNLAADLCLLSP